MKQWDRIALTGMLLPPSVVLGLYIYIGSFNRLLGDDYCTMYMGERLGLLRSIWYWYISWHGGFSASAADWLLSFLGSGALPFHTFIFLSIWLVFAAISVKKALLYRGYSSVNFFIVLLLGIFLIFTTISISPNIAQSLFWWGGVRSYLSPLVLFTLYPALYYFFMISPPDRVRTVIGLFVSFGFVFLIGGFSETFTPVMVVLFAGVIGIGWLVRSFSPKDRSFHFLGAGFAGSLLSLLVVVLAPGNSIRQSFFPVSLDIFTILRVALAGYLSFLYELLRSPYKLTAVLGSVFGSAWLGLSTNWESHAASSRGWWILSILAAGFILAFGCFLPAVYGTSEAPPERTLIIPAFFLVVCFLISGFLFGEWLGSHRPARFLLSTTLSVAACIAIIFSAWGIFQNLYALRDQHVSFAQRWDQVDAQIKNARDSGLQEIHIPAMENWAGVEYPTDNPKYWPNICYSKFYDINVFAPPLPQP
ncbi:MAG TPA: DUF6056 family protein [Anaerolineales bacterium]|nr:DUF6056 family protein [Anaerolineales bacterium]